MSFQPVNKKQKGPDGSPIARSDGSNSNTRHNASSPPARSTATIQHSSGAAHPSIRLTVKAPPSKLRQAISHNELPSNSHRDSVASETPDPAPRPSRATRNPRTVVEAESDEDEDMDEPSQDEEDGEGDEGDDDEINNDNEDDDEENDDAEDDSENDNDDDEEDDEDDAEGDTLDMDEPHPPPPVITTTKAKGKQKANVAIAVAAPPHSGPLKSVEDKEMDDDELSDLEEDDNEEPEEDEEEEDSEMDDDERGTRDGTPDLSKLTRRQQAAYTNAADEGSLMALSNEAQKKKHLTAEEISMRRAEMARRRKNLSEKRNEEEKLETINKLLKKPAPKRRTRAEIMAAQAAAENMPYEDDGSERPRPTPLYTRYVQTQAGARLGVPEEWLDKDQPLGDALRPGWSGPRRRNKLVEEVA